MKVSPTLITMYKLLAELQVNGIYQSVTLDQLSTRGFSRLSDDRKAFKLKKRNSVMIEAGILSNLEARSIKIVIQMMDELKWQNALWYYEARDSRDRTALKELRDKYIFLKTEDPHIHVVNPMLIRKGNSAAVLSATLNVIKDVSRVNKSLIKDLNIKGEITFEPFYQTLIQ